MGWSWRDLQETPWDIVEAVRRFMRTEAKFQALEEKRAHVQQ
jgi:hypothetical protein